MVECLPLDPVAEVRFPPRAVGIFLHPVTHGQVSLAAVNQICGIHEAMNGCKNLDSLKDCFENVNILKRKSFATVLYPYFLQYGPCLNINIIIFNAPAQCGMIHH